MAAKLASSRRAPPRNAFSGCASAKSPVIPRRTRSSRRYLPAWRVRWRPWWTLHARSFWSACSSASPRTASTSSYAALDGARRYELQIWTFRPRTTGASSWRRCRSSFLGAGGDARRTGSGATLLPDPRGRALAHHGAERGWLDAGRECTASPREGAGSGTPRRRWRAGASSPPCRRRLFFFSPRRARGAPAGRDVHELPVHERAAVRPADRRVRARRGERRIGRQSVRGAQRGRRADRRPRPRPGVRRRTTTRRPAAGPVLEALPSVSEGPTAPGALGASRGDRDRDRDRDRDPERAPRAQRRVAIAQQAREQTLRGSSSGSALTSAASERPWRVLGRDGLQQQRQVRPQSRALAGRPRAGSAAATARRHLLDVARAREREKRAAAAVVSVRARRDDSAPRAEGRQAANTTPSRWHARAHTQPARVVRDRLGRRSSSRCAGAARLSTPARPRAGRTGTPRQSGRCRRSVATCGTAARGIRCSARERARAEVRPPPRRRRRPVEQRAARASRTCIVSNAHNSSSERRCVSDAPVARDPDIDRRAYGSIVRRSQEPDNTRVRLVRALVLVRIYRKPSATTRPLTRAAASPREVRRWSDKPTLLPHASSHALARREACDEAARRSPRSSRLVVPRTRHVVRADHRMLLTLPPRRCAPTRRRDCAARATSIASSSAAAANERVRRAGSGTARTREQSRHHADAHAPCVSQTLTMASSP